MGYLTEIERVVHNSEHVRIDSSKVIEIASEIPNQRPAHWMERCPVDLSSLSNEQKEAFLFVFNAISFSYWGDPKWTAGYERGTWSMINSLKTAVDKGVQILEPNYLSDIRQEDLEGILKGNTAIPLFKERLNMLRELGRAIDCYRDFIEKTDYDAIEFTKKLVSVVPSFRDCSEYKGNSVTFNKRAQLLASDLSQLAGLKNVDELTACADYILPMVLRYKGILVYSSDLAEKVDNKTEVIKDSEEEIEIRANTIWAVELIKRKRGLTAMQVNDYLWLSGDSVPEKHYYHRTRTTAY